MVDSLFENKKYDDCIKALDKVFKIDEGNSDALYKRLLCKIGENSIVNSMNENYWKDLDNAISYEKENNVIIVDFIERIINTEVTCNEVFSNVLFDSLRRIINDKELRARYSLIIGDVLLETNKFDLAKRFYEIYISEVNNNQELGYLKLLFCEYSVRNEEELFIQPRKFTDGNIYLNALSLCVLLVLSNNDCDCEIVVSFFMGFICCTVYIICFIIIEHIVIKD